MLSYFIGQQARRLPLCVFLLTVCVIFPALAQEAEYFPFYTSDSTRLHALAIGQRNSLRNHLVVPQNVSSDYRNSYKDIVDRNAESCYRNVRNFALLDTVVNTYMQAVFRNVLAANKELASAKLIVTSNPIENASALADGTIFFNIGLLAKLENESQIAFILCHELAHVQLKHMERGIRERLDAIYSKEFKKQFKEAAREKYNRHSRISSFFEEMTLGSLHNRRSLEMQADSLGYVLLSKTNYNTADAYTALQLLDRMDEPYSAKELNLSRFFSCEAFRYDFTKKPAKTASIFAVEETKPELEANSDTLKTHPDCEKRMRYIKELELLFPAAKTREPVNSGNLEKIKAICQREVVQSWYDNRSYDYALFNALLLLEEQPQSTYFKSMVMLCLYELKRHLQLHKYSEIVSTESAENPENLNQLLRVLNNLNTSDFKGLGSCFAQQISAAHRTQEYELAAQFAFAMLRNDAAAADEHRKLYFANYKAGRFMKSLFLANQ